MKHSFFIRLLLIILAFSSTSLTGETNARQTIYAGIVIHNHDQLIPYFLRSIEKLDYNKKLMQLQFDVCNSSKEVQKTLFEWVVKNQLEYEAIDVILRADEFDGKDLTERNRLLAWIKDGYLSKSVMTHHDYCLILSSDVFLLPRTLPYLLEKNKPIISPLLRPLPEPADPFRNFFGDVTESGYYKHHPDYNQIANMHKLGTFKVPCVHSTYLINTQVCDKLNFSRHFKDWEFLSFSQNARENGVDQYICNEREFGFFLHFAKKLTPMEEKAFNLAGTEFEINGAVLDLLLLKHYENDPHLKEYAENFNFSDYAIYRVKNHDLFYLDEVNDFIKKYILKPGLSWEEHIHDEFKKYAKPGTVVIDIGGHIGTHTLNLSRIVGDEGKVYVFEPQAKMFCELAINMHLNKCLNVEMFHNALGNEEKWIEIFIPDEAWKKNFGVDLINEGHGTVTESSENFGGDRARMIRLDSLNLSNISLIKIDVEGFEIEVIEGGIETIKRNKPVMIIEIFQNQDRTNKIRRIENLGYICVHLRGDDFLFLPPEILEKSSKDDKENFETGYIPQRQLHVAWEGSFLDLGSLSNVNRFFTNEIEKTTYIQLTRVNLSTSSSGLLPLTEFLEIEKKLKPFSEENTEVTVRHEWPPRWARPKGKWVLIQPWEFGSIPSGWIKHLKEVDEIWVPTTFVKNEYIDSGVPEEKVKVVPNGYDPEKFNVTVAPLKLPTDKTFKFLFLGGTLYRKGIDILLESYLKAFKSQDDVCLVIKDSGVKSFYAGHTYQEQIESAKNQPNAPEILYLDQEMTTDEIAALYRACDCFVLPYRGEGFALPVLEAMACGLPVVVTAGGATDDFVTGESGWFIPSKKVSLGNKVGNIKLVKEGWWLESDKAVLSGLLSWITSHPTEAKIKGLLAAEKAKEWTWEKASKIASHRLFELTKSH